MAFKLSYLRNALIAASLIATACTETHVEIGGDDGGLDSSTADASRREQCGSTLCATGQVCCNESCGICTPPDGTCIALLCAPSDAGQDASREQCGNTLCPTGEICCNATCNLCAPPGLACAQTECDPADGGPSDGGPSDGGREQCGSILCPTGETCCNESCGICVPPDGTCSTELCAPDAGADAGEICGVLRCGPGLVCCNPAMSTCVEPGMACAF